MRRWIALFLAGLLATSVAAERAPDIVLRGTLSGVDQHTYRELPFDVPAGISRITVDVDYTGREEKTAIDLGLEGPGDFEAQDGFRGWSGGSKRRFTVSATDATASFLPGAIVPGRWRLLLGIPNIRPAATSTYTARIWLSRDDEGFGPEHGLTTALATGERWYRGDLHMHSAHSDGGCLNTSKTKSVPCPLFLTVVSAAKRGLDFIAVSEHNTMSQVSELREMQPYFDTMLLIPAREITTFEGHANLFGVSRAVDFRVGSKQVPDWNALLADVARAHGVISINHPRRPNDETCMGCGFTPHDTVDMREQARYAMEFCVAESCGKCTPCRIGSVRGVETIDRIAAGIEPQRNESLLRDLCDTMTHGSLCAMGGLTPLPVLSALDHFHEDFARPPREAAA